MLAKRGRRHEACSCSPLSGLQAALSRRHAAHGSAMKVAISSDLEGSKFCNNAAQHGVDWQVMLMQSTAHAETQVVQVLCPPPALPDAMLAHVSRLLASFAALGLRHVLCHVCVEPRNSQKHQAQAQHLRLAKSTVETSAVHNGPCLARLFCSALAHGLKGALQLVHSLGGALLLRTSSLSYVVYLRSLHTCILCI